MPSENLEKVKPSRPEGPWWLVYLINFSGVNESDERFHIKEMFRDKMCKTTVAPSDGLGTTLNDVVYFVIYVIAYRIRLVKFRSNI